jgi:SAM-dependent methyltransferase
MIDSANRVFSAPKIMYNKIQNTIKYRKARISPIKNKLCCFCENKIRDFLPYRGGWKDAPLTMLALGMIGSDIDHFFCPVCGCHDRERHLFLYLRAKNIFSKMTGSRILHFAPENKLTEKIQKSNPEIYIQADLMPSYANILRIDIQKIPFDSGYFDFVIANHVLEHIDNDLSGLSELRRVLKNGGFAILQTPYSTKLEKTWSDPGIDDDFSRLQIYGQEDHVRLYGKDIFARFESFGFALRASSHQEELPDISATKYGVNSKEPFFLFEKLP